MREKSADFHRKKHVVCLTVWLWAVTACLIFGPAWADTGGSEPAEPVVSEILVTVAGRPDRVAALEHMARRMIVIESGKPFSAQRLEQSVSALKQCRRFREIHVDSKEDKGHLTIVFELKPFQYIKRIRIFGKYPLFEKEILNAMTVFTGDVYDPEKIARQSELVNELYRRKGFTDVDIKVGARQDPGDDRYIVNVYVLSKPYRRLKALSIEGNRAFSDIRLKMKMRIWRASFRLWSAGRFIEKQLTRDIDRLLNFYRKKGYADVRIESEISRVPDSRAAAVDIRVIEGPRYRVEFKGNTHFRDRTLRKEVVLFVEGDLEGRGVRKSVRNIRQRYRKNGYAGARVRADEQIVDESGRPVKRVTFEIDEGPPGITGPITITGNHSFPEEKIRRQMLTRPPGFLYKGYFNPEVLDDDVEAVRSFYRAQGFPDVEVTASAERSPDSPGVDVVMNIEENVQTRVASVDMEGLDVVSFDEAIAVLDSQVGTPFRPYMVKSDENALSALIAEQGYPHVTVTSAVTIDPDRSGARIRYQVDPGPFVRMGDVYFSGNFRTRETILRNEVSLDPEAPFSLKGVLDSRRNLQNLNCIDSVGLRHVGLKEKRDTVHVFAEFQEKKPYFIEAGGGYQNDKGLFAHGQVGDRNLFGKNRNASLSGEVSEIGYRYDASVMEPRLFGTRTSAGASAYAERSAPFNLDFESRTYGGALTFGRKLSRAVYSGLSFRFEQREQIPDDEAGEIILSGDTEEFERRRIFALMPSIRYDSRDSFVRPKKGVYSTLSVDVSKGLTNTVDDFSKTRFDFRLYRSPLKRLTIAWLNRVGYLSPYGDSDTVPDDQLFYLGGTQDVRGFRENRLRTDDEDQPVGGRLAVAESVEFRIDIGRGFEMAVFLDAGTVNSDFGEITSDTIRVTAGGGLRYITPIGAMGLLYGHKLDRRDDESAGRLHFSIGYTF